MKYNSGLAWCWCDSYCIMWICDIGSSVYSVYTKTNGCMYRTVHDFDTLCYTVWIPFTIYVHLAVHLWSLSCRYYSSNKYAVLICNVLKKCHRAKNEQRHFIRIVSRDVQFSFALFLRSSGTETKTFYVLQRTFTNSGNPFTDSL